MTARFAEALAVEAKRESLDVRVIPRDILAAAAEAELRHDYRMIVLSGVVSEFRSLAQLRTLFGLAARCLVPGGMLVANAFLTRDGYVPDDAARQFAQLS